MKKKYIMIPAGIILILLLFSCKQVWEKRTPDSKAQEMPRSCPTDSRNCARLSVENSYRMDDTPPLLLLSHETEDVWNVIDTWAVEQKAEVLIKDNYYRHYKVYTSLWKFPDDIFIEITPVGYIVLQSQSRIGKSDLGKNPKRLKELVAQLEVVVLAR